MKRKLEEDLARLEKLAFKRLERCGALLRRFHELRDSIELMGEAEWIGNVYDWLLVPLTLWPIDFEGVAGHVIRSVEGKEGLDPEFRLLLRMLKKPPPAQTQQAIAEYERTVEAGEYHGMLRKPAKFAEMEAQLQEDRRLTGLWEEIKKRFDTSKFRSKRGVIRRRLSQERNFREGWRFNWSDRESRFRHVFDAFCYAWSLYGMENDKPLVMKLSINPTPYGTMIFVPNHWSFDPKRDLDWGAITKLHKAQLRGGKKGPKLSAARVETRRERQEAQQLWDVATEKGLKGEERYAWICKEMGKDERTDPSWLYRLLRKKV